MTLNFSETIMRKTVAVLAAGTLTGAVDLLGAFASYSSQGATVDGILKYIAGGLLGPTAMQGGIGTALLGLLFHFALTTGMAGVYMLAAIKIDKASMDISNNLWRYHLGRHGVRGSAAFGCRWLEASNRLEHRQWFVRAYILRWYPHRTYHKIWTTRSD